MRGGPSGSARWAADRSPCRARTATRTNAPSPRRRLRRKPSISARAEPSSPPPYRAWCLQRAHPATADVDRPEIDRDRIAPRPTARRTACIRDAHRSMPASPACSSRLPKSRPHRFARAIASLAREWNIIKPSSRRQTERWWTCDERSPPSRLKIESRLASGSSDTTREMSPASEQAPLADAGAPATIGGRLSADRRDRTVARRPRALRSGSAR